MYVLHASIYPKEVFSFYNIINTIPSFINFKITDKHYIFIHNLIDTDNLIQVILPTGQINFLAYETKFEKTTDTKKKVNFAV